MNGKAFAILNPRSFVGIFSDYGCENTETSVSLTDSDVLSQKGKKTEVRPEKPKVTYFGCAPDSSILSVRTKSITDNFVY